MTQFLGSVSGGRFDFACLSIERTEHTLDGDISGKMSRIHSLFSILSSNAYVIRARDVCLSYASILHNNANNSYLNENN